MLEEFKEYRPYKALAQFRREIGKYVDDKEVSRLEQYVFVPINLNYGERCRHSEHPRHGTTHAAGVQGVSAVQSDGSNSGGRSGNTSTTRKSRGWSGT